jgi:hypothetical protein
VVVRNVATPPIDVVNLIEVCALTSPVDVSVSRTGALSVSNDYNVVGTPSVTVNGTFDVLGIVGLGSFNLPPVPANLTLVPGSAPASFRPTKLRLSVASQIFLLPGASMSVVAPRTAAQAARVCVECQKEVQSPSCVVRDTDCLDSNSLSPVPYASSSVLGSTTSVSASTTSAALTGREYSGACVPCACQGGPSACSTQRTPFSYGKAWCFIDSASRSTGCVGSDGVSAR